MWILTWTLRAYEERKGLLQLSQRNWNWPVWVFSCVLRLPGVV